MDLMESALENFRHHVGQFRPHARYLVADLMLLGFAADIEENAEALHTLIEAGEPRRVFPLARSVFEASQMALLLATHPAYDYAGVLAWIFYLRKDHRLHDEMIQDVPDVKREDVHNLQQAVEEIRTLYEEFSPGGGALVDQALQELESRRRSADNWLGRNVASALESQWAEAAKAAGIDAPPQSATIQRNVYAMLSRGAHPHSRVRPSQIRGVADGEVFFEFEERDMIGDTQLAVSVASSAVKGGAIAFAIRRRRFAPD